MPEIIPWDCIVTMNAIKDLLDQGVNMNGDIIRIKFKNKSDGSEGCMYTQILEDGIYMCNENCKEE